MTRLEVTKFRAFVFHKTIWKYLFVWLYRMQYKISHKRPIIESDSQIYVYPLISRPFNEDMVLAECFVASALIENLPSWWKNL